MSVNILSLESRLPEAGVSVFSIMSALAAEHGAVNLSQGFPDFELDPVLPELVAKHLRAGHNQYAPSAGLLPLRERISALTQAVYGAQYDPVREVTVTSGATEALFCAIAAVVREGDEVIVFEPAYDSYAPAIRLNGGIPVFIPLDYPAYSIPWEAVKRRISQKTRLIILNSPHNPTGATLQAADLEELSRILHMNDIFLISDEVYEHIIFEGAQHESVARHPSLASRAFIVSSFGKSFHATGWKVGYALAPALLMDEFRKVHQYITFSTSTPFQWALADYMADLSHFTALRQFYQEKRDAFRALLAGSRFDILPCYGTYFQCLGYRNISEMGDVDYARHLTIHNKIASVPVSVFYHTRTDHQVLRFCFAKKQETLERAAEILVKL